MPRQTTTIGLFLASPSDVEREREIVTRAIDAWNQISGRRSGVYVELLKWETSVAAGFSDDGQSVVNEEIGEAYDALLCVFWGRLGTKTARSDSGTVEEYERASRRRTSENKVELAFLFKDSPIAMRNIDPEQMGALNGFKARLESDGAFYKSFSSDEALIFEVNLILDKLSRVFVPVETTEITENRVIAIATLPVVEAIFDKDDDGIIDVLERIEQNSKLAGEFLDNMSGVLNEVSRETNVSAEKLKELKSLGPVQIIETKPIIHHVSDMMDNLSIFLENRSAAYASNVFDMANDARKLINLAADFNDNEEDIASLKETLSGVVLRMEENILSIDGMKNEALGLQRMTKQFNGAKRRLGLNVDAYIADTKSAISMFENIIEE